MEELEELVSAIITTYGRKFDVIKRSIESVLCQTYKNIEIILIDDNDPDSLFRNDIKNGIKHYSEIRYVPLLKNSGAQKARNTGIEIAKGDFIAFLDDDDEWLPEKIEKQMDNISENVGLVYCMGYTVFEDSERTVDYVTTKNFRKEVSFVDLLYGDYIGTTTQALIPKGVFKAAGLFDTDQPARQDYEMWIRISKHFKCVGVAEPLFRHYVHEGEQISKNNLKSITGFERIYNKNIEDYKKHPFARAHICMLISNLYKKQKNTNKFLFYRSRFMLYIFLAIFCEPKKIMEHLNNNKSCSKS